MIFCFKNNKTMEVVKMVEYFEVRKVGKVGAKPEEVVNAWIENLHALKKAHPRVFKKVVREILAYTGEKEFVHGLVRVAEELLERHKKNRNLQSVKIAITYKKYINFHYGSLVKMFLDGSVVYNARSIIDGYGFIIHNGEEAL